MVVVVAGAGVNHGSPLVIPAVDVPTWVASRLANPPASSGEARIATNTTREGLMLNPILVTAAEARVVARRLCEELLALKRLQAARPKM